MLVWDRPTLATPRTRLPSPPVAAGGAGCPGCCSRGSSAHTRRCCPPPLPRHCCSPLGGTLDLVEAEREPIQRSSRKECSSASSSSSYNLRLGGAHGFLTDDPGSQRSVARVSKVVLAAQAGSQQTAAVHPQRGFWPLCKEIVSRAFCAHPGPPYQQPLIREFECRGGITITVSVKLRENDSLGEHRPGL